MGLPHHIAIIMDGNGRWAKARKHNRLYGHIRGAQRARDVIEHCSRNQLGYLTLYAFSRENWQRPFEEVAFLMKLLVRQLKKERNTLMENNICFRVIGDLSHLPQPVQEVVSETIELTQQNTGMILSFALSYGSQQEICNAVQQIAKEAAEGRLDPTSIDQTYFAKALESSFLPDPDLIIRTSGEARLSNFLLWQAAYSELYFTHTLWPDFTTVHLDEAFSFYGTRERRFGQTSDQLAGKTMDNSAQSASIHM